MSVFAKQATLRRSKMTEFWTKNTICLITGASRTIGKAIGEIFAERLGPNSLLILSSRDKSKLEPIQSQAFKKNPGLAVKLVQWDFKHSDADIFKSDLVNASLRDGGGPGSFEQAIIIHNAAQLGDMGTRVSKMRAGEELYDSLNINLVSMLTLNSVFLEVFSGIEKRTIVNMTAPSAIKPTPCFGVTSMTKSSRQILLSILALEETDIKVLHFDPVLVDSESLRAIRDDAHDPEIRAWIQGFYDRKEVLPVSVVAESLCSLLERDTFKSGEVLDAKS